MSLQSDELNEGAPDGRAVVNGAASVSAVPASIPSAKCGDCGVSCVGNHDEHPLCDRCLDLMWCEWAMRDGDAIARKIAAQAIEAGTAKTAGLGPQGESAVPNGDAS